MMNKKGSLINETTIKLLLLVIPLVVIFQIIANTSPIKADDEVEKIVVEQINTGGIEQITGSVKEDSELHNCKHWDWEIYRGVKWRCNSEWYAQDIPDLQWATREERMKELLTYYGKDYLYETFFWWGKMFWVYPELAICIAKADTTLGKYTKSTNNLWNVWNNDRWDTVVFDSEYKAIKAIYQTLNNQYLWGYQYIAELSRKFNKDWKIYASSQENWHNNVVNCMSVIRWETVSDRFAFRF